MGDLSEAYEALSEVQEIFVMPIRMKDEKIYIPTDDEEFAIMGVDYFLDDNPLMLFAPKQVMEACFFSANKIPRKNLPLEIHVPGDLISKSGGIPVLRMKFITENRYAEMVAEIQNGQVTTYMKE